MGGGIALKSEKGKGSSFEFTCTFLRAQAGDVPAPSSMDPEPEAAYSRTLPESGASAPRQKTILLVEDNDLNLQITRELLSKKSYRILEAVDGTKAIETVQRALSEGAALDMILMDLRMPVLDGYQTTAILRKMDELKGIPIIAMTADVRNNVREAVFQAGMDDFLSKPINPPDLFEMVEKHLARTAKAGGPSECPDSVPGIRIEEGVRRVGGDRVFYYSILKQFAANYSGEAEKLEASFSSGDMKTLVLLAHTMKGAAATIGAGPLADRAEELQRMASANDPVPTEDISRGIKEFSESLDAVLSSIDSVLGDTAVQEAAEDCSADAAAPTLPKLISLGAEEYGRARFLCGRIGECVLQDIPATRRSMDELGILLKDTEYYRDYAALARCIQEFEIIAARDSARVLGERLVNGGNRANA
jgi:CheY-like chemotaxis protein/HPt (histidine-containing phosphotransfer) domain-containing protein